MHRRQLAWLTPIFSLLVLTLCLSVFAQTKNDLPAGGISGAPYRVGEKLTYNISFANFGTAAHAETFVAARGAFAGGREGIELRARVETIGLVSAALFAINNEYVAYVDPQTGLPFRTQLIKRSKPLPDAAFDDPASPTPPALADVMGEPLAVIEGAPNTYDLLSALYRLRALPLASGASFRFTAQQDGAIYDAELKVTGRETTRTPAGSFNTYATQLRVRNNPANNYGIRIYFSEDERHWPVLITAQHIAGEVRAVLASAEIADNALLTSVAQTPPPPAATPTPRPTPSPTPTPVPPTLTGLPFSVGEELNFNFYLGASKQPIGVANFQVRPRATYFNRDGVLLSASMYTTDVGQRLFPVNDKIDSYVDAKTLLPYRTQLRILEGSHHVEGIVAFDQERGSAVTTDSSAIEIPVGTYELVSALYAMRSFDLTPPKRNAVSLLLNKRPRTLVITALSREVIELGGERIPAVQLSLVTDEAQGDRLGLRLWISSDRRRLPLRITANTPLGSVRADLSILPLARQ